MAATGKQLKQSVKVFHSLMLYRRLPIDTPKTQKGNIYHLKINSHPSCVSPELTLIIKAVDSINRGALVVTAEQEKVLWVFDLVG